MSKEARSKGACWTCKLRRKKCDEERPACSAGTSLPIPCFGYDPPSWADGGEMQKAKAEELQIVIRELASVRRRGRRKHILAQAKGLTDGESRYEKVPDLALAKDGPKAEKDGLIRERVDGYMGKSFQDLILSSNLENLNVSGSPHSQNLTVDFPEYDDQANLLMYYLDVHFPSQFPFYNLDIIFPSNSRFTILRYRKADEVGCSISYYERNHCIMRLSVWPRTINDCKDGRSSLHGLTKLALRPRCKRTTTWLLTSCETIWTASDKRKERKVWKETLKS